MLLGAGSYLFRYAIGTDSFQPEKPMDAVQLVEQAADLGFELVQFADNLPLEGYSDAELDVVRETAIRRNIVLEAGTAGARQDRLLRYLDIAVRLDAKLLRLTPHAPDTHVTKAETLEVLKHVLPQFRRAGVSIALENHFTMTSEDLSSLVSEAGDPLIGVCLDTANSIVQQEWPRDTVRLLRQHAISLHLKDYKIKAHPAGIGVIIDGAPLGQGDQDIPAIFRFLENAGKQVNVILEQWMRPADTQEETLQNERMWIRQSVESARKHMAESYAWTKGTGNAKAKESL
ncbi:sugar phosphate isomerase/epimerase family protein [Paenibacillus piri]|uniref:Sugar phosphate isomerase/epimerase n=1 Tax=Paenibacillus piri TaxID=2547395 RepID=A0A4R5K896_9BACL|nr:sugar phosphate isomerase/epimerase family protein [Paenibacillus piri]TDF91139.1 sugar phosphate isomerase/epimerase [Paenibacillus piri]